MTPEDAAARLAEVVGSGAVLGGAATADVAREQWPAAVAAVRDDEALAADLFDGLLGVDLEADGVEVVVRLWSTSGRHAVVLRTRCPADDPRVPSLADVFAGAAWSERETAEMLGVAFDGHPGLTPLLLPTGFAGHPLRKAFVLARRQETAWPGAVEPGHSTPDPRRQPLGAPRRRR
ncbi:MAG TPA: NADH-quinone oxidoreductase subunit C [Mycobacteriales bacterium]|nr:NADH-quinone oxidoreductase subunit C [Mycobacteriales bacterium]